MCLPLETRHFVYFQHILSIFLIPYILKIFLNTTLLKEKGLKDDVDLFLRLFLSDSMTKITILSIQY